MKGGDFGENYKYNAREIRFTTKGGTLYAIALGWPADGKLVVKSLAEAAWQDQHLSLLGYDGKVTGSRPPRAWW